MSSSIIGIQEASNMTPCQKFEGHTGWVTGAIHLPGGQRMLTCSSDGSLRVWNLKSGQQIGDDWRDGDSEVRTMALSPDGMKVVSGGSVDGAVKLWDIDTGEVIAKWMGHTKAVWSVCWSRDGQRMVSGSYDGTARQWDVENGETILGPIETGHEHVEAVVYSPDMSMFATGGGTFSVSDTEHPVKIWDAKTSSLVATLKGHTDWVFCLAWTPDGKTLISGSVDSSIRTWNTTTWTQLAVLDGHNNAVYGIAISPNGRILASASYDNTARLWNLNNGQSISSPFHHANFVNRVSFSADGKLLATGCDNHNAYTWDISAVVRDAGLNDLPLDQHDESVLSAEATQRPVTPVCQTIDGVSTGVPQGSTQKSSSAAQIQSSSQPHLAVSTSTAPPVVASTTSNINPHAKIKSIGCWTRFWHSICCTCPEYTHGHH